jgi:hypothetical protein
MMSKKGGGSRMNRERRKAIAQLSVELYQLRERIERLREDESEYISDLAKSSRRSVRGKAARAAADALDTACDTIEEAASYLDAAAAA